MHVLAKNWKTRKSIKFQIRFSQRICVQNTSEKVRLKNRDTYYVILHFTMYCEHLQVFCEHIRALIVIIKFNIFRYSLLSLYARRSTEMLVKCSYMQKLESTEQVVSNALFLDIIWQKVAENGSFEIPWFLIDSWCD